MQALQFFMVCVILYYDVDGRPEITANPLTETGPVKHTNENGPLAGSGIGKLAHPDTNSNQKDNLDQFSDTFKDIYKYTLSLLTVGMQSWLTGPDRDLDKIEKYLGYSGPTVNLINDAMTELLGQQRIIQQRNVQKPNIQQRFFQQVFSRPQNDRPQNGRPQINNLLDTYYYCCDVKHVRDGGPDEVDTVKSTFETFLDGHSSMIAENMTQEELEDALKSSLDKVDVKMKPEFRVTIALMKNRMCVDPTTKMGKIATIIEDKKTGKNIGELANRYSKCATGTKVNENHLYILRNLVPKMFLYAYDYVKLFLKLYEFGLDEENMITVRSFSTFMERFTSMFVVRYFEFRGGPPANETFLGYLGKMTEFCNPTSTVPNVIKLPNISNFKSNEKNVEYAKSILSETLKGLVKSFEFTPNIVAIIEHRQYTDTTKEDCMKTITKRINEGLEVMNEYSKYFFTNEV